MELHRRSISPFTLVQRRIQRWRWVVLGCGLGAFYLTDVIKHTLFAGIPQALLVAVNWAIIAVIAGSTTIVATRLINQTLARAARLDTDFESARRAAEQLEIVQNTARSVAHNLNQPLTIIIGYTQELIELPVEQRSDHDLQRILQAAERAAMHVRQLQQVSRYTTTLSSDGRPMLDIENQGLRDRLYQ